MRSQNLKNLKKEEILNNQSPFHIDVNVTSICNLACTYCSEGTECGLASLYLKNTQVSLDTLISKVKNYSGPKKINFWGGEPLVNWDYCTTIINETKNDKNFSYFFYTNGVLIKDHLDEIKKFGRELGRRLTMQISFDGRFLTDTIRIDKSGKGTSDRVIEGYNLLKQNNIQTSLKSVISSEGFPHLYDSFLDLYELQGHYNPTPDLYSNLSFEEFEESLKILGEELEKIMIFIYENNLNPEVFSWFRKSKAICSAGANLVGVDLTGDLYPCHGCFYDGRDENKIGKIENFEEIDSVREKFRELNKELPFECQSCNVNFCMKCQAANLSKSKKDTFEEKWTDYQSNWQVCKLFKFVDKYNKTIHYLIQEKRNNG